MTVAVPAAGCACFSWSSRQGCCGGEIRALGIFAKRLPLFYVVRGLAFQRKALGAGERT